ncbi:hypothetical protein HDU67_006568 [Dinochytrium kinnereticum]|nr:hypothetical protein HDU67_006568 [Dinochytrium kinnereticum]
MAPLLFVLLAYLTLASSQTTESPAFIEEDDEPVTTTAIGKLFDCDQYRSLCLAVSRNRTDVEALCQTVNSLKTPIAGNSEGTVFKNVPVPTAIEMPVPLVGPSGPDPYVGCAGFGSVCGRAGGVSYICTTTGSPSALYRNVTGVCIGRRGVVEKLPPYVPMYEVIRTTTTLASSTATSSLRGTVTGSKAMKEK